MSAESSRGTPHVVPSLQTKKERFWHVPGSLFFSVVASLTPELVLYFVGPGIALLPLTENERNFVITAVYEFVIIGTLAVVIRAYGKKFASIGLGPFKAEYIAKALLAFAVYMPLSVVITAVVSIFFPYDQEQAQPLGFANPIGLENLYIFVALVVLAPLAEELLFRGFAYTGLRTRLSFVWSSLIISVLFAVVHGQINVGLDVFALSLVLCYLREKTNSLWPSILLHAFKNAIAFTLLFVYGFTG